MTVSTEDLGIKADVIDIKTKKKKQTKKGNGQKQAAAPIIPAAPVVLDPANPMESARKLVLNDFFFETKITLWRHRECFWRWTGSYYELTHDDTIRAHVWRFLDNALKNQLNNETGKWELVPFKPKPQNVSAVADALCSVCELDEHTDAPTWITLGASMPAADEMFACANGLLHLPTGKLYSATPDYFCLVASTVVYDSEAKAPKFDAFLIELLEQDTQAIDLLQDWFGYVLSPDTSQQKIMGIIGPTRSGKGTLARLMRKLLGEASVAGPTMSKLGKEFGLQDLITKTLAIISDVRIGSHTDKATIVERLLTISGEDGISIQRKFKGDWNGKLLTRLMLMSNELLALTDSSGALVGRLLMIMLTKSFYGKEDPGLTNKLAGNATPRP